MPRILIAVSVLAGFGSLFVNFAEAQPPHLDTNTASDVHSQPAVFGPTGTFKKANVSAIQVTSSSFKSGQLIPKQFTADGKDISPALSWSAVPAKARAVAIICVDPDAPVGDWYHWFLLNLPVTTHKVAENFSKQSSLSDGSMQGTNDFQKVGYNGPAPPPGKLHHYHFRVLALDTRLGVKPGASKSEVLSALKGHILAEGEAVGTYSR